MPYNPRRQGAVETVHNIIENWFESGLRLQPATSVEELNRWALDFMIWYQSAQKHTRHGMTRIQCWLLIKKEQLRELPSDEILQALYVNPEEERIVDGSYTISYRGNEYKLKHIPGLFRGAKVIVAINPYKYPTMNVIWQGNRYEVKPIEKLPAYLGGFRADAAIIGQEYKSPRETLTQQAQKRFENMAYGEERKKDAVPFEGLKVFGHHAEKVGNLSYIEKQGAPLEIDRNIVEKSIPFTEFLKRLIQQIGPISPELNQQLKAKYGDSIEISRAEEVIRQITEQRFQINKEAI
jgi:hypothetical protein